MMETNKYYTPSIEEFHVGFELEIKTHELRPWEKHTWLPGDQAKSVLNYLDQIRVKYLDSEDLIELGFNKDPSGVRYFEFNGFQLYFDIHQDFNVTIYNDDSIIVFQGDVKNKSELKRILKMIGAIE